MENLKYNNKKTYIQKPSKNSVPISIFQKVVSPQKQLAVSAGEDTNIGWFKILLET